MGCCFLGDFAVGGVHQGLCRLACLLCDRRSCQHARNFFQSRLAVEGYDSRCRAVVYLLFFDSELLLSPGGDLRRVGDDEDLSFARELSQLSGYGGGGRTADAAVDLVEDERPSQPRIGKGDADSQQHAAEFSCRGNLVQFVGRVVGERCDAKRDRLKPCCAGRCGLQVRFKTGLLQFQGGQDRVDLLFERLFCFKARLRELLRYAVVGLLGFLREGVLALQRIGAVLDEREALLQLLQEFGKVLA